MQGKCHNEDGSHKSLFKFLNPTKSKESRKLCAKWLANLKNANLPLHVHDYTWSGAHKVCEDHFTPVFKDKVRMCLQMTLLPLLVSSQPAEYSGMGIFPPRWTPAVPTRQAWQYESGMPASPMIKYTMKFVTIIGKFVCT